MAIKGERRYRQQYITTSVGFLLEELEAYDEDAEVLFFKIVIRKPMRMSIIESKKYKEN